MEELGYHVNVHYSKPEKSNCQVGEKTSKAKSEVQNIYLLNMNKPLKLKKLGLNAQDANFPVRAKNNWLNTIKQSI